MNIHDHLSLTVPCTVEIAIVEIAIVVILARLMAPFTKSLCLQICLGRLTAPNKHEFLLTYPTAAHVRIITKSHQSCPRM